MASLIAATLKDAEHDTENERENKEKSPRSRPTGNKAFPCSNQNETCPLVWPGVSKTTASDSPTLNFSPSRSSTLIPGMRLASQAAPTTTALNFLTRAALPPTWSPWWCVFKMKSSLPSNLCSMRSATGPASAGSTTATAPVASSSRTQA